MTQTKQPNIIEQKQLKLLEAAVSDLRGLQRKFTDFATIYRYDGFLDMALDCHNLKKKLEKKIESMRNSFI